ncbi:type II secretion system protein [Schlesneria paludicola]|uniref:type II secretion system protein n=1 Tax=Schlesneria paludicola TaxID=360056 RepID=UPI00029A9781|nr:type II secretion system protein GspG [Schlesneria paludicola]
MKRIAPQSPSRQRRGFTLTEVLLVLAILGVIAAMVVPNLMSRQQEALNRQTKVNITSFERIAQNYAVDHEGEWPRDINSMMNPGQDSDGKNRAPYMDVVPKDGWNQPLYYEYPNSKSSNSDKPAIWSSGKNKQNEDGGGDDINNWSTK